jgi:hypothetical protein
VRLAVEFTLIIVGCAWLELFVALRTFQTANLKQFLLTWNRIKKSDGAK